LDRLSPDRLADGYFVYRDESPTTARQRIQTAEIPNAKTLGEMDQKLSAFAMALLRYNLSHMWVRHL